MIGVVIALLAGCPKRADQGPSLGDWLVVADQAWEDRGRDGFDPVEDALDQAWGIAPDEPAVQWRLARLSIARGLAAEDDREALDAFATARAQGLECLRLPASFQVPDGTDPFLRLRTGEATCAAWTGIAWARWWLLFGPDAAALDAPRIRALADAADRMQADPGLVAWTRGIVAAGTGDGAVARKELERAIDDDPDDLWRRVDLVRLVAVPGGDEELIKAQRKAIVERSATSDRTPENRRAVAVVVLK